MNNRKKTFYIILAVVIITGMIFSLYAFSKIKSIHELRAVIKKSGAEHELAIKKDSDSSTDSSKSTLWGKVVPQKMWTTEFIETAYSTSRKYGIRDLTFEQKSADNSRRQTHGKIPLSLQSYPVRMTYHAGYREMAGFIQDLQGFEKLVTIESLKIKRENNSFTPQRVLAVEMTASTYAMEGI